jgi:exosome complex RNA-binding protein Rrp42 (RNase PH superfamily)
VEEGPAVVAVVAVDRHFVVVEVPVAEEEPVVVVALEEPVALEGVPVVEELVVGELVVAAVVEQIAVEAAVVEEELAEEAGSVAVGQQSIVVAVEVVGRGIVAVEAGTVVVVSSCPNHS